MRTRPASAREQQAPFRSRRPAGRRGHLRAARRPAASGYHRLHQQVGSVDTSTPLIVSPSSLEPPARLGAGRAWGLAAQLYSVTLRQSWGIGDLTDLTDLAVWSAARARRRVRAGQPAARGGAGRPDGAVAVPADLAALRQPDVPAGRGDPRVRLRPHAVAYAQGAGTTPRARADSSSRSTATPCGRSNAPRWKTVYRVERSAGPRARLRGVPASARVAASTTSRPGVRWPRSTAATGIGGRRSCRTRAVTRSPSSPPSTAPRWTSTAGCSGCSTSS